VRVRVHLFYGDADNIVPLEHGEHLARILPSAKLYIRPEEGHLGGLGATREIFAALLGDGFNDGRGRIVRAQAGRVRTRKSR
jgi:pimeloyl-ACP methyl ester carboxylesterase